VPAGLLVWVPVVPLPSGSLELEFALGVELAAQRPVLLSLAFGWVERLVEPALVLAVAEALVGAVGGFLGVDCALVRLLLPVLGNSARSLSPRPIVH